MSQITLTDLIQNIPNKKTLLAQQDLMLKLDNQLALSQTPSPTLPYTLTLMINISFAFAISNLILLLITTSLTIHFRNTLAHLYQIAQCHFRAQTTPANINLELQDMAR